MRILMAIAAAVLMSTAAMAEYAQKLPEFGNSRGSARTLEDVTAVKVIEDGGVRGVIASYKSIYAAVAPHKLMYAGTREMNTNKQLIFITGLDHNIVTDRCFIFHRMYGEKHLLFAWDDGVATVKLGGRQLRLRRYTVRTIAF